MHKVGVCPEYAQERTPISDPISECSPSNCCTCLNHHPACLVCFFRRSEVCSSMFRRRIRMPGLWVAALCLLLQLGRVISKEAAPVQKSSAAASSRGSSDRSQIKDAKIVVVVEEDPFTKRTLDEARARVKAALAQSASGESPTINTKAVLSSYQMAAIKGKGKLALSALDELASFHMVRAKHVAPPRVFTSTPAFRGSYPSRMLTSHI